MGAFSKGSLFYHMLPFMQNPHSAAIRKYLFEMLKDRYQRNEKFVDRLSSVVVTKDDYESLGAFVADLYESGFLRAVDQYRDQMSKLGLRVSVVPESQPKKGKPIFGD